MGSAADTVAIVVSSSDNESTVEKLLPIQRLGLAMFFLAVLYMLLLVIAVWRVYRVSSYVPRWNTQRILYWFLAFHAFVRTSSFFMIVAYFLLESTTGSTPFHIILFITPEFVFQLAYVIIIFNWLEVLISSFEQFSINPARFDRGWKIAFVVICLIVVTFQVVFYAELLFSPRSESQAFFLEQIFYTLAISCFVLPSIVFCAYFIFICCVFSGFPFRSDTAKQRTVNMNWVLLVWSGGRILRGVMMWLNNVDGKWMHSSNEDVVSMLIVVSILLFEVLPFVIMLDWSLIATLILGGLHDDERASMYSVLSPDDDHGHWDIDVADLEGSLDMAKSSIMATVVAKWNGRRVAVKLFRLSPMAPAVIRDLADEAARHSAVEHPHIVQFYGVCILPDGIGIVSEFMSRGSLRSLIKNSAKPFSHAVVLQMAVQIVDAMNHLQHSSDGNPLVIGYVSSRTIYVDSQMGIKVGEVGLGRLRAFAQVILDTSLISAWSAPEVWGRSVATPKSDVYSFGIILWELVTMQEPFFDVATSDMRSEIVKRKRRPPIDHRIHPEFAQIIVQCWAQDPAERPSFAVILRMLEDLHL